MLTVLIYIALTIIALAGAMLVARFVFALPPNKDERSVGLAPSASGPLAEALNERVARHPGKTGIAPLQNGSDAFAARMVLANMAVSSIDAQYYTWHDDLTGMLLLDALRRAADRGVRVRLLLDDKGTPGFDKEIAALNAHSMADVRLYNPFNLRRCKLLCLGFDFFRLNRRMHNKSFTVDNRATILGGRNIGDEYFGIAPTEVYVDLDVLAVGDVVPLVSDDFDRYWNCPSAHPAASFVGPAGEDDPISEGIKAFRDTPQMAEYAEILKTSDIIADIARGEVELEWTTVLLMSDNPAKGQGPVPHEDLLAVQLLRAVGDIRKRFDGISPYFVPGTVGVNAFAELKRAGVDVRILTNSLEATDALPVHAGYAKRRKVLLKAGIELYELRRKAPATLQKMPDPDTSGGACLHAKVYASDGERIFIGSFNFDPRSTALNTEIGLIIESRRLACGLHDTFGRDLDDIAWRLEQNDGRLMWINLGKDDAAPRTTEPGSSIMRNAVITIIGWLPVEWLL